MAKIAFFGDPHFRSTAPEARKDNYIENQDKLIQWIKDTFSDHILVCNGDLFHKARESVKRSVQDVGIEDTLGFVHHMLDILPDMYGIPGNHDLLYHSMETLNRTSLGIMVKAGKYTLLSSKPLKLESVRIYGFPFGTEIKHLKVDTSRVNIAVYHGMVLNEPNQFIDGLLAEDILREFPEYDIIVTGDNHRQFVVRKAGRVLINPGSLKRDNADQVDHSPAVFVYDPETSAIDRIPVPTHWDIISQEHIELVKERDERLKELTEKFQHVRDITLDFGANVEEYVSVNSISEGAKLKMLQWMEG